MFLRICLILLATSTLHGESVVPTRKDVPQNVKIKAIDSYSVNLTWDEPLSLNGDIATYIVECDLETEHFGTYRTLEKYYVIGGLKPEQTIYAAVGTLIRQRDSPMHEIYGNYSKQVWATTPRLGEGEAFLPDSPSAKRLSKHG
ncbi:unnamed protein product [Taenia asiatica]|uniref:Fibronectin type-III domain-containing protein n=1 Tax=Taenia asiatica TaxID=60517 RepID=A0A0R3WEJ7_TAEAS|nr:unnamed protein product [Taenia asiatica]